MLDRPVPGFSSQRQVVAYAAQSNGNWDIWLVEVAKGKPRRLASEAQMESNPLWSNDSKMLGYKVATATGTYNLTGQYFMRFGKDYTVPNTYKWNGPESVQMNHWSPDGSHIAYTGEVISNASGRDQVSYVAMVSDLKLNRLQAITSSTRLLANGCTLGDRRPVFSPKEDKIAFWSWNKDNKASIWLYDLKPSTSKALTSGGIDMYPQWSPDGSTVLFETSIDNQIDLVTLKVPSR